MPLVHVYDNRRFSEDPKVLRIAIREIVAAALHVDPEVGEGQLTPNDIIVMHQVSEEIDTDILLVIEAFPFPGRLANIDERGELIMSVLGDSVFKGRYSFAVAITPLLTWVSSNGEEPSVGEDMSMHAALDRAIRQIESYRHDVLMGRAEDMAELGFTRAADRLEALAHAELSVRPGEPV